MINAPHGMICAALLPAVMAANAAALKVQAPGAPALARFREVAVLLTGRADARIDDGIEWIRDLVARLQLPGLGALGLKKSDLDAAVAKAGCASSMKGNPVALTTGALKGILEAAL
jgi:alcohol dehydrogenase class IV